MIKASFGLTETGSVRTRNEDCYILNNSLGLVAVADGLGGLPHGARASRMAIDLLEQKLLREPRSSLVQVVGEINEETRQFGFDLDSSGFGTTLTIARLDPGRMIIEIAHVGDSAAYMVRDENVQLMTLEHTVAARMEAGQSEGLSEDIPPSAYHTLTQCIGQDLYIDPQFAEFPVQKGDRIFLFTDGVTKPILDAQIIQALIIKDTLERVCHALTFRIEIAGSPDNYTLAALEI